jgi:hypothetical protein
LFTNVGEFQEVAFRVVPAVMVTGRYAITRQSEYFNSPKELKGHATECQGAKMSQPHKEKAVEPQYGQDREWESTP